MRNAMQSQNLKVTTYTSFFQAVQIKNQTVGWVVRPLGPEAVFPKENESGEVFMFSKLCARPPAWGSP